jgi:hypothetical protein
MSAIMEYIGALGYGNVRRAVRICGVDEVSETAPKMSGRKVRRWEGWMRRGAGWMSGRRVLGAAILAEVASQGG